MDVYGEVLAALGVAQRQGKLGGPFGGAEALGHIAGVDGNYPPHWGMSWGNISTSSDLKYYVPYLFPHAGVTYTGLRTYNAGSGDNGEVYRLGVYEIDFATRKPGALLIDAGVVTLTGAAALRTLAASFTPQYAGWHYLCAHFNSAVDLYGVTDKFIVSGVGQYLPNVLGNQMGVTSAGFTGSHDKNFGGYTVSETYAALPSTATAPTAIVTAGPMIMPYIT